MWEWGQEWEEPCKRRGCFQQRELGPVHSTYVCPESFCKGAAKVEKKKKKRWKVKGVKRGKSDKINKQMFSRLLVLFHRINDILNILKLSYHFQDTITLNYF